MSSQTFNFAAMGIADPASPPAGLRSWSKNVAVGKIIEEGLQKSTTVAGIPAWIIDGFVPTDNVIKLTFVHGTTPTGTITNTGCGFFLAKSETAPSPNDDDAYYVFAGTQNTKIVPINGAAGSSYIFPTKTNAIPDVFELYIDRTLGEARLFKNGKSVLRPLSGLVDYTVYGVAVNNSTIASFSIADAGNTLPPYIGRDDSAGFNLGNSLLTYYSGFNPKFARLAGFPVKLTEKANGQMKSTLVPLDKIKGNVFTLEYAGAGIANTTIEYSNFTASVQAEMPARAAGGVNIILSTDGTPYLSDPTNMNYYYTINGSTTGIPIGSYIFSDEVNPLNTTQASLLFNSIGFVTCSESGSGTVYRRVYIRDATDGILRVFRARFNLPTQALVSLTYDPTYFVSAFEQPLDTWVESNVINIDLGSSTINGSEWVISGNAEISWDTGSGWSPWTAFDGSNTILMESSLEPLPVKLRGKSSILPDTERVFSISEQALTGDEFFWSVFTEIDTSVFQPDLQEDPEQTIISLVNYENDTQFTLASVDVSSPTTYSGVIGANTQVTVSAKPNKGFTGQVDFIYSRIDFGMFKNSANKVPVTVPYEATWAQVIAAVNTTYGTNLTSDDYVDEPSWVPPTVNLEWTLTIKSTSLVFIGSAVLAITVNPA